MGSKTETVHFRVHTPNLLKEVLENLNPKKNHGILFIPMNAFRNLLAQVAERAIELDDPKLNCLMIQLTLYGEADPSSPDFKETMDYLKNNGGDIYAGEPKAPY